VRKQLLTFQAKQASSCFRNRRQAFLSAISDNVLF
jgi:hypothetical protein